MIDFVVLVRNACLENGIELLLSHGDVVYMPRKGVPVAGYFDERGKVLAVAAGRSDWLQILAHEFSHLQQYVEGLFLIDGIDPYDELEDWYCGKDLPLDHVAKCIDFAMACEHDAERRTVGLLCQYGMSSNDIKEYIRDANGYVLRHLYAKKHRKWPNTPEWGESLSNEEITSLKEVTLTRTLERLIKEAQ